MATPEGPDRRLASLRALARRIDPSDPGAQNNLGYLFYHHELIPEALEAFRRALELDPRMVVARENLAQVSRESGALDLRIVELQDQVRRTPFDRDARLELGRAYLGSGQYEAAIEQLEELHRLAPEDATALVQLGLVAQAQGRPEDAADWFERACEADPASSVARVYYGEALYHRGMNEAALGILTEATTLAPHNADAYYLLGFVYGDMGRHDAARAATRRAIELKPSLAASDASLRIEPNPAGQKTIEAIAEGSRPSEGDATGEHQAHLRLGLAFRLRHYYQEALREYRLALEGGEDRIRALHGMAEVYLSKQDLPQALELYRSLLESQPGHSDFWNEYGVCLYQLGRWEEANEAFRRAVDLDPSNALSWNNLGVTRAGAGEDEEVQRAFRAAKQAQPALTPASLNLALHHLHQRRLQAAIETYHEVLQQHADNPVAWNGVGLVLMELKRHHDARNAFSRAVEVAPEMAVARYNLGFALSQLGEFDHALRETKHALELDAYYVPQKYVLTLRLDHDINAIEVVPHRTGSASEEVKGFTFDQDLLDDVFGRLVDRSEEEESEPLPADPYDLARDYLAKGLLDAAAAEVHRVQQRGGEPGPAAAVLAEVFARRGLFGEALERFRAARELNPDDPDVLLGEGETLVSLGRGEEALEAANLLVDKAPSDADCRIVRAKARLLLDDPDGAREDINAAIGVEPGRADLLLLKGRIARQLRDLPEAADALRGALELDRGLVQAWHELGLVEEEVGDLAGARYSLGQALKLLPTHLDSALGLANLLRRNGRPAEAVNLLVDYLVAEPYSLEAIALLGRALLEDGRPRKAVAAFERVLRFDGAHLVALFHLGAAQSRLRRFDEAVTAWERVVALSPTGPLAAEARSNARSARELAQIFSLEEV